MRLLDIPNPGLECPVKIVVGDYTWTLITAYVWFALSSKTITINDKIKKIIE